MSLLTQEENLRKMLERAGVLPKKSLFLSGETLSDNRVRVLAKMLEYIKAEPAFLEDENPLVKRIENLEQTIEELKKEREVKRLPSKADRVYLKFKNMLEKEHFGKIVAIDAESGRIVGLGNSVLEAYRDAEKNTSKTKFSYRRVGFAFVHKL
jgi:hypothetical protein